MGFAREYLSQVERIAGALDDAAMDEIAHGISALRERGGRLFVLGVGGSAANASHAVNDFRKICNVEAYAPTDNVSELTARTNDEGWPTVFSGWLETSNLNDRDGILVLSVGGGDMARNVSPNLVEALKLAAARKATIFGIIGRDGGYTKQVGDHVVLIPVDDPSMVTPHSEAFQAVVWHCLVSHPALKMNDTKW